MWSELRGDGGAVVPGPRAGGHWVRGGAVLLLESPVPQTGITSHLLDH